MKAKIEHSSVKALKNTHYISAFKQMIRTPFIKCLTLMIASLFSLNVFAVINLFVCDNDDALETYNKLHHTIKKRNNIAADTSQLPTLKIKR